MLDGVEKREPSYAVGGNINWCSHYGEQYGGSLCDLRCSVATNTLRPHGLCLPGSSVHGIFQVRLLELSCHFLLQGIFQTQGWNPHLLHLLHWQENSLPLAPPGKPWRVLKKLKIGLPYVPEKSSNSKKYTHPNVYSSTICNSQDMEAT